MKKLIINSSCILRSNPAYGTGGVLKSWRTLKKACSITPLLHFSKEWCLNSFIILFLLLFVCTIKAQTKREVIVMANGDTAAFLITVSPASTEGFNVFRKGPLPTTEDYKLITKEPIKPVIDPAEAQHILGDDWFPVSKAMKTDDAFDVLRRLRGSEFEGGILSLLFPSVAVITGRWFVDSTVISGKEYDYKIVIVNAAGNEIESLNSKVVVKPVYPSPPDNFEAEEQDENLKLTWEYPKWNNSFDNLAVRYNVYRQFGKEPFKKINTKIILRNDASEPEFTDVWLQNGQEYSYYVTAVDPIGRESKPSKIIKATPKDLVPPSVPEILSAVASNDKITVSWGINLESDAAGYNVFRSAGLEKDPGKLTKIPVPLEHPFFIDSLIETGIQYFYYVSAVDKNKNESARSNSYSVIAKDEIKPQPPSNITYKLEKGILKLNWKASASKDVSGYNIFRGEDVNLQPRLNKNVLRTTSYEDKGYKGEGLLQGRIYYYSISAVDSSKNESDKISVSVSVPDNEPPLPPLNFIAKNNDGKYIELFCSVSPSGDAFQYKIYKSEPGQKSNTAFQLNDKLLSLQDTAVVKGKTYIYYATAVDTAGNESKPISADTIFFKDFNAPPIVPEITITQLEQGVLLEWQEVIDFDFAGYFVMRSLVPNGVYEKLNIAPVKERRYIDASVGKKYFYKVVSVDTSGNLSDAESYVYLP